MCNGGVRSGEMLFDGADIRFALDVEAYTLLGHLIISGMNTAQTIIMVKFRTIPARSTFSIYMIYGRLNASFGSGFPAVSTLKGIVWIPCEYSIYKEQEKGKFRGPCNENLRKNCKNFGNFENLLRNVINRCHFFSDLGHFSLFFFFVFSEPNRKFLIIEVPYRSNFTVPQCESR